MDYKDLVVTGVAFLGGMIGATYGGFTGLIAGILAGSGVAATWAHQTDLRAHLLRQRQ